MKTWVKDTLGYTALASLFALAFLALPRRASDPGPGPRALVPPVTSFPRVVVLGIDGLDPEILAETIAKFPERMRSFAALAREGGMHSLGTSTPPQSPVAWSNFITGLDPGGHGIFDFLHRDLVHRAVAPSTANQDPAGAIELWGDWKFPTGGATHSNRTGEAFWTILADNGVPADIWRMPANFPVEPALGLSFSGMMTPAIDSAYGECTFYTTGPTAEQATDTRVVPLTEYDGVVDTRLTGPPNAFKDGDPTTSVPLRIYVDRGANAIALDVDGAMLVLEPGEWSEFVPVRFKMLPGGFGDIGGIVRFYLRSIEPEVELYASPVNIDPSNPVAPVAEPSSASADLADRARGGIGAYYTQGMPEDVNALKREVITVSEFVKQSSLVQSEGERMLDYALDHYLAKEDGGLFFFYFSGVDLCSHMMWRHFDASHPDHDAQIAAQDSSWWSKRPGSTWKDYVYDLYMEMDPVLGRLRERIGDDATLIVMSDHGFAPYSRKFSLNTWLLENGYLVLREGCAKELREDDPAYSPVFISGHVPRPKGMPEDQPWPARTVVDWSKTRAYGIGFNGLYLNLAGREQDDPETADDESGTVRREDAGALARELKAKLEALVDPKTGRRFIVRCDLASQVYSGARVAEAPDVIVGYDAGYGNSDEASTGQISHEWITDNDRGGTFNGSHLMVPDVVRGSLLTNRAVAPGDHGLEDLTVEVLRRYGIAAPSGSKGHAVLADER